MLQVQAPGVKRIQPEEEKGGIDARDLIARFRSKQDIYEYLSQNSKTLWWVSRYDIGQYYLPPIKKITKDFLKDVFAGRKNLIPRAQLPPIEVPRYDELSVIHLIKDIMT